MLSTCDWQKPQAWHLYPEWQYFVCAQDSPSAYTPSPARILCGPQTNNLGQSWSGFEKLRGQGRSGEGRPGEETGSGSPQVQHGVAVADVPEHVCGAEGVEQPVLRDSTGRSARRRPGPAPQSSGRPELRSSAPVWATEIQRRERQH